MLDWRVPTYNEMLEAYKAAAVDDLERTDYLARIEAALIEADHSSEQTGKPDPTWNFRFICASVERGLKIVSFDREHVWREYIHPPWPMENGPFGWPKQSLVIWIDADAETTSKRIGL